MPAASSKRYRRSSALVERIRSILPCSITEYEDLPIPVSMNSLSMSLRRTGDLLIRYSDSPSRKTLLLTVTVSESISSIRIELSMVMETSARESCFRCSVPEKIISSIVSPRILRACFSPRTHLMASTTLDLPHPLGPTIAVIPDSNSTCVLSAKDLNPNISIDLRNISKLPNAYGFSRGRQEYEKTLPEQAVKKIQHEMLVKVSCYHKARRIFNSVKKIIKGTHKNIY